MSKFEKVLQKKKQNTNKWIYYISLNEEHNDYKKSSTLDAHITKALMV